jgi:hypothetical protein
MAWFEMKNEPQHLLALKSCYGFVIWFSILPTRFGLDALL